MYIVFLSVSKKLFFKQRKMTSLASMFAFRGIIPHSLPTWPILFCEP